MLDSHTHSYESDTMYLLTIDLNRYIKHSLLYKLEKYSHYPYWGNLVGSLTQQDLCD